MFRNLIKNIHLGRLSKSVSAVLKRISKLPVVPMLKFYDTTWTGLSKTLIGISENIFTPENCEAITKAILSYYSKEKNNAGVAFKKEF